METKTIRALDVSKWFENPASHRIALHRKQLIIDAFYDIGHGLELYRVICNKKKTDDKWLKKNKES